jgi:DNA-binding protein HU-beta/integration host factor subunit alpha
MNNSEVIQILADRVGKSQDEIKRLLKLITAVLKKVLDEGRQFTIPSLGTFSTMVRKERKAYHPQDRQGMILPQKRVVAFRPGSTLKEKVKNEGVEDES